MTNAGAFLQGTMPFSVTGEHDRDRGVLRPHKATFGLSSALKDMDFLAQQGQGLWANY